MAQSTIFALSSGAPPSGVALIRISGPCAWDIFPKMVAERPQNRVAALRTIFDPSTGEELDRAIVLAAEAPATFTGEDSVELQCHGGRATVSAVLEGLSKLDGFRMAEPGEFARQAFENEKLDLTELEGLSDLVAAQSQMQRRQALSQSGGRLRELYDGWRTELIRQRALIEAEMDFADEDDVPGSVSDQVWISVERLLTSIRTHLDDKRRGEIVRDGLRIALTGPPNSGKSSLLNALAQRDVAIVTSQAGTTRDVIDVSLELEGHLVIISDTAGLRETDDLVEIEGIRRAHQTAEDADLVFWLQDCTEKEKSNPIEGAIPVWSKSDLSTEVCDGLHVNVVQKDGLNEFLAFLSRELLELHPTEPTLISRSRHRETLISVSSELAYALEVETDLELRAERLRRASDALGRLTGRVDVEDLLDVIFSEFCIGK